MGDEVSDDDEEEEDRRTLAGTVEGGEGYGRRGPVVVEGYGRLGGGEGDTVDGVR